MGGVAGKIAVSETPQDPKVEEEETPVEETPVEEPAVEAAATAEDDQIVVAVNDEEEPSFTVSNVLTIEHSFFMVVVQIDDVKTAPADSRFPNTNQTKHCFTRYVEFHKCSKEKGEGAPECDKFKRWYRSLCPNEWVERWDEQREEGIFAGPY